MLAQRKKLAMLWFSIAGLIFFILLAMTLIGRFSGGEVPTVWTMFYLPLVVPSLALMISTFVKEEQSGIKDKPGASAFLFGLCFWLSVVYLILPLLIILTAPFREPENPAKFYIEMSPIILGIQALPFGALAFFFYGDWIKKLMGGSAA